MQTATTNSGFGGVKDSLYHTALFCRDLIGTVQELLIWRVEFLMFAHVDRWRFQRDKAPAFPNDVLLQGSCFVVLQTRYQTFRSKKQFN